MKNYQEKVRNVLESIANDAMRAAACGTERKSITSHMEAYHMGHGSNTIRLLRDIDWKSLKYNVSDDLVDSIVSKIREQRKRDDLGRPSHAKKDNSDQSEPDLFDGQREDTNNTEWVPVPDVLQMLNYIHYSLAILDDMQEVLEKTLAYQEKSFRVFEAILKKLNS